MKPKHAVSLLFLLLSIYSNAFGQDSASTQLDQHLTQSYEAAMDADYELRYDSLGPLFKEELKQALSEVKTMDYAFELLANKIRLVRSADGNFITYSWDERTGGTWHDMAAIAQFKTEEGKVVVQQLDSEKEGLTGAYTDVVIYEIHELMITDRKHYLTIGWGTHGSGHHHSLMQIFRIEGAGLVKCKSCFEDQKDLAVVAPRSEKIKLEYHAVSSEITHNEFEYDDEIGFFYPTGNIAKLKLINGTFKQQ